MKATDWVWASQLASGTILWNEYTQASGVVQDFHTLLPLSVAMRQDVTPWMDWLNQRPDIVRSMEAQFYQPMPKLMADGMLSWMHEWETRVEHGEGQLRMFLQEWEHVLTTPGLALYRQCEAGVFQLERLSHRMLTSDRPHVEEARGEWVRTTLRLAPEGVCRDLAYKAWSGMTQRQREQLQPQWAQWYDLFPEQDSFFEMVRRGTVPEDAAQTLDLPSNLDA